MSYTKKYFEYYLNQEISYLAKLIPGGQTFLDK